MPTSVIVSTFAIEVAEPRFVMVIEEAENAVIARSGSGRVITHEALAVGPTLPTASVARTENVCWPTASLE